MTRQFFSRSKRRGQALILVTLTLIPMLGFIGLVTDLGYMHYVQKSAQAAADSAALAAVYRFNKTTGRVQLFRRMDVQSTATGLPAQHYERDQSGRVRMFICEAKRIFNGESAAECDYRESYESEFADGSGAGKRELVDHGPGYADGAPVVLRRARQCHRDGGSAGERRGSAGDGLRVCAGSDGGGVFLPEWDQQVPIPVRDLCELEQLFGGHAGERGAVLEASSINVVGGVDWQGTISPAPNTGVAPVADPLSYLQAPAPCDS